MAKDKSRQLDYKGLEIIADTFTGSLSGALTGTTALTVAATTGSLPTANGSITVANAATPTVAELLEFCVELNAKINAIRSAMA